MSNIAWRKLVCGTASALLAASIAAPVLADEAFDPSAVDITQVDTAENEAVETFALSDPITADVLNVDAAALAGPSVVQVAQGITSYERRRRQVDRPGRGQTVQGRPRPQYDPLGVRMGSFVLLPSMDVIQQYESNIFATPNNEESDLITRFLPNLTLQSDWNNHQFQLETGADLGYYWDNTDEDYQDYFIGASGRVDIKRSTQLRLATRYRRAHESRESPDDADAVAGARVAEEPTVLDIYSGDASLRHDFGRLNATVFGSFDRLSFDDPEAIGGGTITEHDRDRDIYEGRLRVGYEIVPAYEAFVTSSYNVRNYDGTESGTGIDRDSEGYAVAVGMSVDLGGVIFGDFFVGYRDQSYDDPTLNDVNGFGGGGDVTWNVTGLTTITGSLTGDIRETTTAGASGRKVATAEARVDHELRRNIILGAGVNGTRDDYDGISRTDWIYGAGADATYLINRHLSGGVEYEFRQRDADTGFSGDDFTNHVFMVRVGLQY